MGGKEQKAGEETETFRSGRERGEVHITHLQPFGHQVACREGKRGGLKNGKDLIYWRNSRENQLEASKNPCSSEGLARVENMNL